VVDLQDSYAGMFLWGRERPGRRKMVKRGT